MKPNPLDGPILLVDDDIDDQRFFADALRELNFPNALKSYDNGRELLDYLKVTGDAPLIIFCDVNMPEMNGLELRGKIQENSFLRKKSIPFVFFSTDASKHSVDKAYDLTVQGFFKKPTSYVELVELLKLILVYWHKCKHPNSF
jgi:CheY-like chemotaxis protein